MTTARLIGSTGLLVVMLVAACSQGAASAPTTTEPIATNPDTPVGNEPPAGGGGNPGVGGELTVPQPGQLDVHAVSADSLEAAVDGRRVTVRIAWTSGVEPCSVLDTILVDQGEMAFAITLQEGHAPGDNICIEIAKFKFALVDLGELGPGRYTISDGTGGAAPIQVVVS